MKTSSCKAKGRRLQQWVACKISEVLQMPAGKDLLIQSREMGQSGVDVKLIGEAREKYPFSIECKNTENWSVPAYITQAADNELPGTNWQLFLCKNRKRPVVVMDAEVWFRIWEKVLKYAGEDISDSGASECGE